MAFLFLSVIGFESASRSELCHFTIGAFPTFLALFDFVEFALTAKLGIPYSVISPDGFLGLCSFPGCPKRLVERISIRPIVAKIALVIVLFL